MLGNNFNDNAVIENPEALICLLVCGVLTPHSASRKHVPEPAPLGRPGGSQRVPAHFPLRSRQ